MAHNDEKTPPMRDGKYLADERDKVIVRTSVLSILANILLASFKAAVGLLAHSISVILDAVNNLSDALSSIITIIGTKLAKKPANKKHPYGYGRIEYISAVVISVIVLYAGCTSFKESVVKIFRPQKAEYSIVTLVIVALAVAVKLLLGTYVKATGKKVDSKSLVASGEDARNDAILSTSVLAAALIQKFTGFSVEAYVGVLISVFILKSGYEMLSDTLGDILGVRIDPEVSKAVKETVCKVPGVHGAYDLFLNDYGPNQLQGSVHIELDEDTTADKIDQLSTEIIRNVYLKNHVILTAVGIYSHNKSNSLVVESREKVRELLKGYKDVLQMHGFYMNEESKVLKFDVIISFDAKDREQEYTEILGKVRALFPDYSVRMNLDADMSD